MDPRRRDPPDDAKCSNLPCCSYRLRSGLHRELHVPKWMYKKWWPVTLLILGTAYLSLPGAVLVFAQSLDHAVLFISVNILVTAVYPLDRPPKTRRIRSQLEDAAMTVRKEHYIYF
ncbi:hypothetical protein PC116_g26063 [Phytophthora cactorum]|uniref:Uncharacterized protein n=2 Tax=Phytophthora cactorum TaxID=29920 RepID=A0A8T1JQX5_9STRA|nr:hypothetical protein PC112_g21863 [Phytophthora cactorum]KAG2876240.1 hypothetical protein PC114_g24299 [Phytophthora cactorum]KAG2891895.1 hypothetical protein PC117_g24149 [Phytophthora cactorum]KAG2961926.1 hypothetical protein PC118_g21701 [Phytophthora cactorum]KAG2987760.1 hypothetical protein PC120_g23541 [Phytophthora cactorum]